MITFYFIVVSFLLTLALVCCKPVRETATAGAIP
jgi:hypothetical protein